MPSTTLSSTGVIFPDATTQETALRKDTANTFSALQTFSASVAVTGTVGATGNISTSGGAISAAGNISTSGGAISATGNISTSGGVVSDSKGDVRRIIGNGVNTGYNTVLADAGKTIFLNSSQIGITNGIYSQGDVITIVNYGGGLGYMYMNVPTTYISGSTVAKGNTNLTIRPCGVVTVIFINASHCFVSGAVY